MKREIATCLCALACVVAPNVSRADTDTPLIVIARAPVTMPPLVTMPEALRMFREHGFDLLLNDAAAMHAEGDVDAAAHVANPGVSLAGGTSIGVTPAPFAWAASLSDDGAIFDLISGKRTLRARAARAALDAVREHRASVAALLEMNVKQAYLQIGLARLQVQFTEGQSKSLDQSLTVTRARYPSVIDESDLARVEVQKLEADQAIARAKQALRSAQIALATLVGVRGEVSDFDVDRGVLAYRVSAALSASTETSLLELARIHRPEIAESRAQIHAADEALSLEKRRLFPDVALGGYVAGEGTGAGAISPPTAGGSIALNLPIFYQQQGEVRRAEGDLATQAITARRVDAQLALDVTTAFAAMRTARVQVDRMLGGEIDSATRQRDVLQKKFPGQADLNDFLDAERTYINVQLEYLQLVAAYWSAVFALERATGTELR